MSVLEKDFHAGSISVACLLGYRDFRFADRNWRSSRPGLALWFETAANRNSMRQTVPA